LRGTRASQETWRESWKPRPDQVRLRLTPSNNLVSQPRYYTFIFHEYSLLYLPINPEVGLGQEVIIGLGEFTEGGNVVNFMVGSVHLMNGESKVDGNGEERRENVG